METNFTKDALSKQEIDAETGNLNVYSDKGKHVLTLIHPVQIGNDVIPKADMERFNSDVLLHVHASTLYETLELVTKSLEQLKNGKITIFSFPIHQLLDESNNVLKRASKIV